MEEEIFTLKDTINDILNVIDNNKCLGGINDNILEKLESKFNEFKDDLEFKMSEKLVRNIDKKTKELEENSEIEKEKLKNEKKREYELIKHNLSKINQEQKKLSDQMEKENTDRKNNCLLFQKEIQIGLDKLANKGKEEKEKLFKEIEQLKLAINEMGQQIKSLQIQLKGKKHFKKIASRVNSADLNQ